MPTGDYVGPCRVDGPHFSLFGEFLYLGPGGDKVSYALPIDGAITPPSGVGPVSMSPDAVVSGDAAAGFRVGGELGAPDAARIGLAYMQLDSTGNDSVSVNTPFVIRSLVSHPATQAAPPTSSRVLPRPTWQSEFAVQLEPPPLPWLRQRGDVARGVAVWQSGAEIRFHAHQLDSQPDSSNGHRFRRRRFCASGRRPSGTWGRSFPGRRHRAGAAAVSLVRPSLGQFLAGEFQTSYRQTESFTPEPLLVGGWEDERIVSVVDIELGVRWLSPGRCWRLEAGYLFSTWYNAVTTEPFIHGIRQTYSGDISNTLTFDGLTTSAEYRF